MAVQVDVYTQTKDLLMNGGLDLDSDTIKVMLVTSSYTYSAAHTQIADASTYEITGTGYTAGGAEVTGKSVSGGVWDASDTVWTSATVTCRRAIVYKSGAVGGLTDPVIMSLLLDDSPADVSATNSDFTIQWNASGILTIS